MTHSVLLATACMTSLTYSRLEMRVSWSMASSFSRERMCFNLEERMSKLAFRPIKELC